MNSRTVTGYTCNGSAICNMCALSQLDHDDLYRNWSPIFAGSEWDTAPCCDECGDNIDVTIVGDIDDNSMRYHVMCRYWFYDGAINAPAPHPLTDTDCDPIDFDSISAVEDYLRSNGFNQYSSGEWFIPGDYVQHHGEYARPSYHVEVKQ